MTSQSAVDKAYRDAHGYDAGPQGMPIPPVLVLHRLRRQQWLDTEALRELQRKKIAALVNYAYRNVGYYRRLFDANKVSPADIKTVEDLSRIPVTERQVLQKQSIHETIAESADSNLNKSLTSGSSGRPLMVYRTASENSLIDIVWARAFLENGQKIWDKSADYHSFGHIPRRWFERLGIWRKYVIPTFADPIGQIAILKRVRPDTIRGNPYELVTLAETIQRERIEGISPRLVFAMGSLLDQHNRMLIESVLHTKVFDYYGAMETGLMAWECCEHIGYHINSDTLVLEVVNDQGEPAGGGERGKIIVTGLLSYTMPFIRYNIGDIGALSDKRCPCGRGLPLLEHLEGSAYDFFVSADGTHHSPSLILNQIKYMAGIEQYRVIQETITSVRAQIVPSENFSAETGEELKGFMKRMLGNEAEITVEIVDEIPRDASGKMKSIISKVKRES